MGRSPLLRPRVGSTGHVSDHETIARVLWLLTALMALLLLNVIALWAVVT